MHKNTQHRQWSVSEKVINKFLYSGYHVKNINQRDDRKVNIVWHVGNWKNSQNRLEQSYYRETQPNSVKRPHSRHKTIGIFSFPSKLKTNKSRFLHCFNEHHGNSWTGRPSTMQNANICVCLGPTFASILISRNCVAEK